MFLRFQGGVPGTLLVSQAMAGTENSSGSTVVSGERGHIEGSTPRATTSPRAGQGRARQISPAAMPTCCRKPPVAHPHRPRSPRRADGSLRQPLPRRCRTHRRPPHLPAGRPAGAGLPHRRGRARGHDVRGAPSARARKAAAGWRWPRTHERPARRPAHARPHRAGRRACRPRTPRTRGAAHAGACSRTATSVAGPHLLGRTSSPAITR